MILATRIRKARQRSLAPLLDADVDENFDRDVAGLCEQAQRCGLVGTDDAYAASSDDGWGAFCKRHGTYGFDWTWEKWVEDERARHVAEQAAEARREARRREARIAAKLTADQAWWESQLRPATPKPPPPSKQEPLRLPPLPILHWIDGPAQNVEPWFDPEHVLTQEEHRELSRYAINYFAAALRVPVPTILDMDLPVKHRFNRECARDADAIAGTLYPIALNYSAAWGRFVGMRVALWGKDQVLLEVCFG